MTGPRRARPTRPLANKARARVPIATDAGAARAAGATATAAPQATARTSSQAAASRRVSVPRAAASRTASAPVVASRRARAARAAARRRPSPRSATADPHPSLLPTTAAVAEAAATSRIAPARVVAGVVADAAARAVEFVGLPEAQLNLAHAVVYLATAPKSNRAYAALGKAQSDARAGGGEVPMHLRDAHYSGASSLGHGKGYASPHNVDEGWLDQEYRPSEVAERVYYEPTDRGYEGGLRWGAP